MKKRIYLKFLIAYLICALAGFLGVTIFCSALAEKHLIKTKAESLYSEVSSLAHGRIGTSYLRTDVSSEDVYANLYALATYQSAQFWLLNSDGDILIDTSAPYSADSVKTIPDFNPSELESRYYQVGNFFGMFAEETLSVVCPITDHFTTRGYFCAHFDMDNFSGGKNAIMNICYLTLGFILIIFLLLLFSAISNNISFILTQKLRRRSCRSRGYRCRLRFHKKHCFLRYPPFPATPSHSEHFTGSYSAQSFSGTLFRTCAPRADAFRPAGKGTCARIPSHNPY